MTNVREESRILKEQLQKSSALSKKLHADVTSLTCGLERQLRAVPTKQPQMLAATQHTLACIDDILKSVENLGGNIRESQRRQEKKFSRLQNGGSTVASLPRKHLEKNYPDPKVVPAFHDKDGLVARQETFDSLHDNVITT